MKYFSGGSSPIEEKIGIYRKKMVEEENRYFWLNLGIETI